MNNLFRWIKAVLSWLIDIWHVWLALGVVILALVAVHLSSGDERMVRLSGMILQLLGVGTVAWGIGQTRAQFGHASLFSEALGWIKRFPKYQLPSVTGEMHGSIALMRINATGTLSATQPERNLEDRVLALELSHDELRKRLHGNDQKLIELEKQSAAAIANEATERRRATSDILRRLEVTATGGIHITAIGAVWLFVGVVLGTAAPEISCAYR